VQELDPELISTVRAPLVAGYAEKQGIEALLSLLLQKVLIDRPDDPVTYLIDALREWNPRMVVMLGPPASGKYTLARLLAERLALEHVSPSDLIEGMVASDTIVGNEMKRYVDSGEAVPDDLLEPVILSRLRERDCRDKGWVMDAWPRTPAQAQRLVDENLLPQIAVVLQVEDALTEDRVSFRLENPNTGRLYNYKLDPPPLGEQVLCTLLSPLHDAHSYTQPLDQAFAQCFRTLSAPGFDLPHHASASASSDQESKPTRSCSGCGNIIASSLASSIDLVKLTVTRKKPPTTATLTCMHHHAAPHLPFVPVCVCAQHDL
jgi:adenylate kinase family enzyme